MYNRYLDQMPVSDLTEPPAGDRKESIQRPAQAAAAPPPQSGPRPPHRKSSDLLGEISGGLGDLLGGVLKNFSLENFDTGDILLVLIILFLFLEGDNLELVITLGLMLLLGLGDD